VRRPGAVPVAAGQFVAALDPGAGGAVVGEQADAVAVGHDLVERGVVRHVFSYVLAELERRDQIQRERGHHASAPRATTAPGKSSAPRSRVTRAPSAVTSSRARTAADRLWLPGPEPWVPVATEPATEMCGSDARFASANPAACSSVASRAYVVAAPTRTRAAA